MQPDNDALLDWMTELKSLWVAYDKPVDEQLFAVYSREFADIPLGLLTKAIGRCKRTSTFFPRISEVWKAVRAECNVLGITDPQEYANTTAGGVFLCAPGSWQPWREQ